MHATLLVVGRRLVGGGRGLQPHLLLAHRHAAAAHGHRALLAPAVTRVEESPFRESVRDGAADDQRDAGAAEGRDGGA